MKSKSNDPIFPICGSARIKVLKMIFRCFADFIRRIIRPIRKIRKSVMITSMLNEMNEVIRISIRDTQTMKKSNLFHASSK
jgi:hypothetical protein